MAKDDGHGKFPLVVLNSTTMASKRQYIPKEIKFLRIRNRRKTRPNEVRS